MSGGHRHGHSVGADHHPAVVVGPAPTWLKWVMIGVVLVITASAAAGMWVLRPTGHGRPPSQTFAAAGVQFLHGRVASIAPLDCAHLDPLTGSGGSGNGSGATGSGATSMKCGRASVTITAGGQSGQTVSVDVPNEVTQAGAGTGLVILKLPGGAQGSGYTYYDMERGLPLALLGALFAVVVIAVARGRGLRALIGLGVAALVVARYLLPALLEGHSPVALGLVTSVLIMVVVLYLTHGVSARTTTALLGTFAGLGITAAVGEMAVNEVHLTGVSSDENSALQQIAQQLDLRHMLTCGIILAGLGILNDVTITQSSAVWELHEAGADPRPLRLYRQAMRIGRDHIASTVYTVVFAYAGAALSVLLLISLYDAPLSRVLTSANTAEELVRTMAGAIGLVLAVPATTALAVLVVTALPRQASASAVGEPASAPNAPASATAAMSRRELHSARRRRRWPPTRP